MTALPPREPVGFFPTPLHPLPRLTAHLGGPHLWIKRDDLTGFALGGNKVRKLEFFLPDDVVCFWHTGGMTWHRPGPLRT